MFKSLFKPTKKHQRDYSAWVKIQNKFTTRNVYLEVSESDTFIYLLFIEVKDKVRGKGFGTNAINKIINYANKKKKPIILTATDAVGTDINKLIKYYKKFGFKYSKLEVGYRHNMYYMPENSLYYSPTKSGLYEFISKYIKRNKNAY